MRHGIHRPNSCCVLCYHRARQDDTGHMPLNIRPDTTLVTKRGTHRIESWRGIVFREERGAFDRTW